MTRRIFCKVLLVVAVTFGLFVFSGVLSAQGSGDSAFERVRDVQEGNTNWLMAIDDVEGTAIGFNENDQLAVKVFTARWGVRGIPQELDGVPVQVIVTGKFYALPQPVPPLAQERKQEKKQGKADSDIDPTARFGRPVPIGVSTGNEGKCSAGTIGCRVKDEDNNVYALSNNHVYALENEAAPESEVLQPGLYDTHCVYNENDEIGTLFDFVVIDFSDANNTVDAAIALTTTGEVGNATPSDGYGIPSSTPFPFENVGELLDLPVQKYGRTTSLTEGTVTAVNFEGNVGYSSGTAYFVDQIVITGTKGMFSKGGDSGSLIVTDPGKEPVGLLFAGGGRRTIANPIDAVLAAFGVTIDDSPE